MPSFPSFAISLAVPRRSLAKAGWTFCGSISILPAFSYSLTYSLFTSHPHIHQIDRIVTYVRFLRENPQELELLFKELLIGVTSFFRDPKAWEDLKNQVLPALLKDRLPSQALRVWVPGCATGEEAYSLAIIFKEALEQIKAAKSHTLQIFATDLDRDAIEKARTAIPFLRDPVDGKGPV